MVRLGCRLPTMGKQPLSPGLGEMARVAEESGVDTLHLADHVVLPESTESRYPFTQDGSFPFSPESDWYDVFASCAWVAAQTTIVEVGPSVLVLPQRHPLEVAKMSATLSSLSGGRFFLGVGAGWLREEFVALGCDFDDRAKRMEESIEILRLAWSGVAEAYDGAHYKVPLGTHCRPLPPKPGIPVLLGGMSNAALRRAAQRGDGWIALIGATDEFDTLGRKLTRVREMRAETHPDRPFRTVIRVMNYAGSASETAGRLQELGGMDFDEIVVDPGWNDLNESGALLRVCRRALDDA